MRHIFIIFCILLNLTSADELQRIKSIVKDITKLRSDYKDVKSQLEACRLKLKEQENINLQLRIKNRTKIEIPKVNEHKYFKASSFRLNKKSSIYNGINAKELFKWDEGVSFTSNTKANGWVKITGYFIDKVWKKSKKELWIKDTNVMVRK